MNQSNNKNISNSKNKLQIVNNNASEGSQVKISKIRGNVSHFAFPEINGNRINLVFQTPAGFKVVMSVPENVKMGKIFKEYAFKVGVGPNILGTGIFFLFNGRKLKKADENLTPQQLGMFDSSIIAVVDTKDFIGAKKN